ncbi:cell wall integrity and stress response component [Fusarium austroafricanum]|uniref:Cell wall integrity and stress response component n=1 Tax=Fusarium austroafricanum TaxID=2364996 RepID=A0A8H4P3R8_9HYPO|nr:cell wall integrity and stress response component [Fusarium austroafricanum]
MSPISTNAQRAGLFLIWAYLLSVNALDIEYCASFNTGQTPRNTSIWQTNGLCHDFCVDNYAFAITQDKLCWCSNYVPEKSTQENNKKCNIPCPAWPDEVCGGDGLYGYVSLGKVDPSGTRGPDSSTKTSDEETSATSTAEEKTTSATGERTSVVQTVTAGGTIRTVTVAAPTQKTAGTSASDNSNSESTEKSGLNTGQVVGIVVSVIAAVIGAAALALFLWFRRKKQQNEQEAYQDDPSVRDSSSGIARPDMSMAAGSPVSGGAAGSRNSTLQVDPRMDPFKQGLYVRSASHESINTLRDDHDYSRRIQAPKVLRATNPDPTPEP